MFSSSYDSIPLCNIPIRLPHEVPHKITHALGAVTYQLQNHQSQQDLWQICLSYILYTVSAVYCHGTHFSALLNYALSPYNFGFTLVGKTTPFWFLCFFILPLVRLTNMLLFNLLPLQCGRHFFRMVATTGKVYFYHKQVGFEETHCFLKINIILS